MFNCSSVCDKGDKMRNEPTSQAGDDPADPTPTVTSNEATTDWFMHRFSRCACFCGNVDAPQANKKPTNEAVPFPSESIELRDVTIEIVPFGDQKEHGLSEDEIRVVSQLK